MMDSRAISRVDIAVSFGRTRNFDGRSCHLAKDYVLTVPVVGSQPSLLNQGLLFCGCFKVSSGTLNRIEAVLVPTLMLLK